MATVQPRARVRKSSATLKCPVCGTPLIVTRDDDDRTTLTCRVCSRRRAAEWVASAGAFALIRKAARKVRALAMADADDVASEIVLAVLEGQDFPAEFNQEWLDQLAVRVAGRMRNVALAEARPVDTEVLAAVVPNREESELDTIEAWEEKEKADKSRAARIKRALKKLPPAQRGAVRDRYFGRGNLAAVAREGGKCDSSGRMNLLRACRKLKEIVDCAGYALAA
jgi:DNA-directed RNA polymerase specialized sigma24 family protein